MREKLRTLHGRRITVTAVFKRYGTKRGWKGKPVDTLLFVDVRDLHSNIILDHIWFTMGVAFKRLNLQPGDTVKLDARSRAYKKGYRGHRDGDEWYDELSAPSTDYRLSHPTNIRKLNKPLSGPISPTLFD